MDQHQPRTNHSQVVRVSRRSNRHNELGQVISVIIAAKLPEYQAPPGGGEFTNIAVTPNRKKK